MRYQIKRMHDATSPSQPTIRARGADSSTSRWSKLRDYLIPDPSWWSIIPNPGDQPVLIPGCRAGRVCRAEQAIGGIGVEAGSRTNNLLVINVCWCYLEYSLSGRKRSVRCDVTELFCLFDATNTTTTGPCLLIPSRATDAEGD